jgi:hypothetical protein
MGVAGTESRTGRAHNKWLAFPPDALRSDRRDQSIKVFEVEDLALDVNCARPYLGAPDPKITINYDVKPAMAAVRQ